MTVLSVYEVSSVFFQRSTDAGYIDFCRQSFKFSRGQHATNEAVEHLDVGLLLSFNDPPPRRGSKLRESEQWECSVQPPRAGDNRAVPCRGTRDTATVTDTRGS